MTIHYIGVDPGLSGGLGLIDAATGAFEAVIDMPTLAGEIDVLGLYRSDWLPSVITADYTVVLEEPQITNQSYGGANLRSTATSYRNFGELYTVLRLNGFRIVRVAPAVWTQNLHVGHDKEKHVKLAEELFPGAVLRGPRGGKLDGRADALLLAHWGRFKKK